MTGIEEEIEARVRYHQAEIAKLTEMLGVARKADPGAQDFWKGLDLAWVPTTDALVRALRFAGEHGRSGVGFAELETVLSTAGAVTSGKTGKQKKISETYAFRTISLAVSNHPELFVVSPNRDRGEGKRRNYLRSDVVSLRTHEKEPAKCI